MTPSQFLVALFSAILFMCTTAVLAAPLVLFEDINFRGNARMNRQSLAGKELLILMTFNLIISVYFRSKDGSGDSEE